MRRYTYRYPLRRVMIRREEYRGNQTRWRVVLECGHYVIESALQENAPKRKRCRMCPLR